MSKQEIKKNTSLVVKNNNPQTLLSEDFLSETQVALIKDVFGKGLTQDEFKLFLYVCNHTKLDPMLKQVYAVKYGTNPMSIITAIDGYRLVAERTRRYCPGRSPTFQYDKEGNLFSATAYVKKLTDDGTWHEVEGLAFFSEYAQYTKEGKLNKTWKERGHGQLAKCAEALGLRKAFPNDLSSIRTEEEMGKVIDEGNAVLVKQEKISEGHVIELMAMYNLCLEKTQKGFMDIIKHAPMNATSITEIPHSEYEKAFTMLEKGVKQAMDKQKKESEALKMSELEDAELEKEAFI